MADACEALLKRGVFAGIGARRIEGYRGIEWLRRDEVELVTILRYYSIASVREFPGAGYESAVVPAAAQALLSRFDLRSQHYELRESSLTH